MSAEVESVVDSGVSGQEALGGAGRSKALHPPLSSPGLEGGSSPPGCSSACLGCAAPRLRVRGTRHRKTAGDP
jgi:hypothetical protein